MTDSDKIQTLPLPFLERMKEMLGDDYDAFLKSYKNPRTYGLRVNTAKLSCQDFQALSPFPIRPIPWINTGYFYEEESRPARCPYYQAGLYYLQEPSAMTPASRLPIEPGDFVLDLCAAPGGKATALGAALNDTGFLLANDISTSRARALLRNLELFGMKNMLVTAKSPPNLPSVFLLSSIRSFWTLHAPGKACSEKRKPLPATGHRKNLLSFLISRKTWS